MNRRQIVCAVLALLWMAVIFAFSSQTADVSDEKSLRIGRFIGESLYEGFEDLTVEEQELFAEGIDTPVRKTAHLLEYMLLGGLILGSFPLPEARTPRLKQAGLALGIAALYAGSDELHQLFVEGRACQLTDALLDSFGALLGILLILAVLRRRRKRIKGGSRA